MLICSIDIAYMRILRSFLAGLLTVCIAYTGMNDIHAQRQMEDLDRGLIAIKTNDGVFLSWRMLGHEYPKAEYNLYRGSTRINPELITGATNYLDPAGTLDSTYAVAPVIDGIEQALSDPVSVWAGNYRNIPLKRPAGGTVPDGGTYSYSPNDASVGDLDGDGQWEIVLKWDPSNSKDNSQSGYTGNVILDAYEMNGTFLWRINLGINIRAGAHYTQFMVYDLDGDGIAEIACKTAPGTKDATGNYLQLGPAAGANHTADYRNSSGYVLSGPEYFTIFDGSNGHELATTSYVPARGSVTDWGDDYGNRVDRFLACVAYLDGQKPSVVMCRGYYRGRNPYKGRTVLAAWDYRNGTLTHRWTFTAIEGGVNHEYTGQGNHNISVADVDVDGRDEIIYGACAIDDDGTGLWSTGLGHGDAMHVSDIDPNRPGLEKWGVTEPGNTSGSQLLDARTGEMIWGTAPGDVARGVSADLTAAYPGMECWGGTPGLLSATGQYAGISPSSFNFLIWWDGDELRELLDYTTISKYPGGTLLSPSNCVSNNGTKATPVLAADLLGDWREEVIFRTTDNAHLRIFVSTEITQRRLYTLMHDPHYRLSIAWQNVGYNQPPHTGFFLGDGMKSPPIPPIIEAKLRWHGGNSWDINTSLNWLQADTLSPFQNGDDVLFDNEGSYNEPIALNGTILPGDVTVFTNQDVILEGPGSLSGNMELLKTGTGTLTLNSDNDYSGNTLVWQGNMLVNGTLAQSPIEVNGFACAGGSGNLGNGLTLRENGGIIVGDSIGSADTLRITGHLITEGNARLYFDLSDDSSGTIKSNDLLWIEGDLTLAGTSTIEIHRLDKKLQVGHYTLIRYTGTFSGNPDDILLAGMEGFPYELENTGNVIRVKVLPVRDPESIVWKGTSSNVWDLTESLNWLNDGIADWFVSGDTVLFDDSGSPNTTINLVYTLPIGRMRVDASLDYRFQGSGSISGAGGILKSGSGKLSLVSTNDYTGATLATEGILEIPGMTPAGQAGPLGAATSHPSNLILSGATLRLNGGESSSDRGMTIGNQGATLRVANPLTHLELSGEITGEGDLTVTGFGELTLSAANSYTGGTLIWDGQVNLGSEKANKGGFGPGTVTIKEGIINMFDDLNSETDSCSWNLEVPSGFNAWLNLDSRCSLTGTLEGSGTLNLYSPWIRSEIRGDWSEFGGLINVTTEPVGGWLLVGNQNGFEKASIDLSDDVTLLYRPSEDATVEIGMLSGTQQSVLGAGGGSANHITWVIGTSNRTAEFHGLISDKAYNGSGASTSIVKEGTGSWTLTHANAYSGTTVVNGGALVVNNLSGSGTGSGNVSVNAGATLSGNGRVEGPVTIAGQGSLFVGNQSEMATFTVNKDVTFQTGSYLGIHLNPADKESDRLISPGSITLGGILYISKSGTGDFAEGDIYKILESANITGNFAAILPSSPGEGLEWDTSRISSEGILRIVLEGTVGTNDRKGPLEISIYPNPGNTMVNLAVDPGNSSAELMVKCYDQQGRQVLQDIFPVHGQTSIPVDIREWSPGIYSFVIQWNSRIRILQFLKQ